MANNAIVQCPASRCDFSGIPFHLLHHYILKHHHGRFYCYLCPFTRDNASRSDLDGLSRHLNCQHLKAKHYACQKKGCGATYYDRSRTHRCKHKQPPPQAVLLGQLADFPTLETIVALSTERHTEVSGLLLEFYAPLLEMDPADLLDIITGDPADHQEQEQEEQEVDFQPGLVQDEAGAEAHIEAGEGHPEIGVDATVHFDASAYQTSLAIPFASIPLSSTSTPPQLPSSYPSQPGSSLPSNSHSLPGLNGIRALATAPEDPTAIIQSGGELGSIEFFWHDHYAQGWNIYEDTAHGGVGGLSFSETGSGGGEGYGM